ncbi:hypothetical protein VKT23_020325 [Stygiomarasmius scandens]|uniref:Ubiquitin 3 binding protein But2 C-terminal domain-containing protein n=1 Tax=Marasmiellus scandens TaxID=2682957 RepID=A0ABR1IJC6_9AGAR
MFSTLRVLLLTVALSFQILSSEAAHASFSVHYPWATRREASNIRSALEDFKPFCGQHVIYSSRTALTRMITGIPFRNPQPFAAYQTTFLSFSGHPGDLAHSRHEFPIPIASNVPISPTGQLCFDVQMPPPLTEKEHGMFLFEAADPSTGMVTGYHCADVFMVNDDDVKSEDHPAMCAKNNDTLIPMPDEW